MLIFEIYIKKINGNANHDLALLGQLKWHSTGALNSQLWALLLRSKRRPWKTTRKGEESRRDGGREDHGTGEGQNSTSTGIFYRDKEGNNLLCDITSQSISLYTATFTVFSDGMKGHSQEKLERREGGCGRGLTGSPASARAPTLGRSAGRSTRGAVCHGLV